ncbi:helix-turn-helix domain-containing protein (plasmid) [Deinococcus radiomollis]|uniref:TetR/AcrR family transcriptional regulator n=1 Tax=Deinococcus radiomollis TaxID=468916 RepID=UPI003892A557
MNTTPTGLTRHGRADAQRNRQLLLDAALVAFAQHGIDASLEAIARNAGVGIGTLYRHFPTRETLALAAYQHDVERLCEAADELLRTLAPDIALREWLAHFSGYINTKRGMSDVIRAVVTDPQPYYAGLNIRERMQSAVETLLSHGTAAGVIRNDIDAEVVMLAMIGYWYASAGQTKPHQATRLLDLLIDGLRVGKQGS